MEQKLSLDSESEYGGIKLGDQDQEVSTDTMTERGRGHRGRSRRVKATQSRVGLGRAARKPTGKRVIVDKWQGSNDTAGAGGEYDNNEGSRVRKQQLRLRLRREKGVATRDESAAM
ncbi:hypothetical protein B296_00003767 [Ensete ventricosum]|uniref:Uncharacterized protein n=1 Tax=Ensete ventricosum TaxID=4639 RepID=A0A427B310_ENSVE|nr:hypothetical protein B296_00003767 [Ensete ventricosum]